MANIFKRASSQFWYARFQHNGKSFCISTGAKDKNGARKALQREQDKIRGELSATAQINQGLDLLEKANDENAQRRVLTSLFEISLRILKKIVDAPEQDKLRREFAERLMQGSTAKIAITDAWKAWETSPKKRNPKDVTAEGYKGQWMRFQKWTTDQNIRVKFLHDVTDHIAEKYAGQLWAANVSPRTYNAHINFLKSMFDVLKTTGGLTKNVWKDIPSMEAETKGRRNLSPEELSTVCTQAKGVLRYWLAIGLYTGLRLGDVVTLKWSEIDLRNGVINRSPLKTRRKNKIISFPIHTTLKALLLELKKATKSGSDFLFPAEASTYMRDPSAISKQIQKFFMDCGIQTTETNKDGHRIKAVVRVGFHSLRHSFVSLCAQNKVPQVAIMEMVGHGSPAMTALYSHAGEKEKARAIAALPAVKF